HVWAPDVKYNPAMGKWVMYACTSSTFCGSNLCMLTSDTIDGTYEWQAGFIYSGVTADTLAQSDILDYVTEEYALEHYITRKGEYNFDEYPNAIDPTVFYDADGKLWMVYGSYSGGIFLLELDETTGLPIHPESDWENGVDAYYGKRLIGGGHKSIEGPYILYDAESGYYFLFVSYGWLGADGGYQIRVFRAEAPDGPYVDMAGNAPRSGLNHAYFGLKLSGNYNLPSLKVAYKATGHNSAFVDDNGLRFVVSHVRFDNGTEGFSDRTKQFFLNEEGWPCLLPYQYNGPATLLEENRSSLSGKYYVVNQGMTVDGNVAQPFILNLAENGNIYSAEGQQGTWEIKDGTPWLHFTLPSDWGDVEYSGYFARQLDEAGTEVTVFTAAGENESIWGVRYDG
ncbi:MAG: glycoside hydrolase family 43 protein, partial [bacterium]